MKIRLVMFAIEISTHLASLSRILIRSGDGDRSILHKKGQQRLAIDPTGELSTGEKYENFAEFKQREAITRDDLTHSLVESLLAYSSGRSMERLDQYEINDIVERVKADGYGLRTAVFEVLTSEIFRSR